MEWIGRLNDAIQYMEEHLKEELDYAQLGRIACCSSYHFQRMFAYIADVTLSEYIRRRRMSLAAVELLAGRRVLDVALDFGYSSPTAFSRAFQSVHGIVPSQVKSAGVSLKSYPPLTFQLTVKGAYEMNYRIEHKEAFRIVGASCPMSRNIEENFALIPPKWDELRADGTLAKLPTLMNTPVKGVLGVCFNGDSEEQWSYCISVASTLPADGLEERMIPAATWAIFPGNTAGQQNSKAIQALCQRILTEWLPNSGYEYANGPDIEVYLDDIAEDMHFEIWIPVKKK